MSDKQRYVKQEKLRARPLRDGDLVETKSPEASRAFVTLVTQLATEVGGRRVIANEALVPMTIPDQNSTKPDSATRLLVVTEYPTTQACLIALEKRKEWGPEP